MIFKSQARVIFFDTDSPFFQREEMLDIILSPGHYWVKRVELPVKYLRDVKKLLPSLFEEILPKGEYSYTAYRDGETYLIFAYNDEAIVHALNEKGIRTAQINKVYFAQSEFGDLEGAVALNGDNVMMVEKGLLLKLPAYFADSVTALDLSDHKCSSHNIALARYTHIADKKSMILFASSMAVLIAFLMVEWGIVSTKTSDIEAKRTDLFETYGLKSTRLQNEAIMDRLEKRYIKQTKIRSLSSMLFDLKLNKTEKMTRFDILASKLVAEFNVASKSRVKALTAQLKAAGLVFKESYKDDVLQVELKL